MASSDLLVDLLDMRGMHGVTADIGAVWWYVGSLYENERDNMSQVLPDS